jgi:hypothetical protein
MSETSNIGSSCKYALEDDDVHLMTSTVAMIQRDL